MGRTTQSVDAVGLLVDTAWNVRNKIINGAMEIDQRRAGALFTPDVTSDRKYTVDRWCIQNDATGLTVQRVTDAPSGFLHSLKTTITSAITSGQCFIAQFIEAHSFLDLLWGTAGAKPLVLSFWVKSSVTGTFTAGVEHLNGSRIYPATFEIAAAGEWQKVTLVIPGETSGTWGASSALMVYFDLGCASTNAPNAWATTDNKRATGAVRLALTVGATFQVSGVQAESGEHATPFERRPIGFELALCQRFFEKSYDLESALGSIVDGGKKMSHAINATAFYDYAAVRFAVTKRVAPNVFLYSPSTGTRDTIRNYSSGADGNYGSFDSLGMSGFNFIGSGMTANQLLGFHWAADAEI